MKQSVLAASLGISAAMLSRLRKRGMPISTVAEAQAWRRQNLDPAMTKTVSPPIEGARLRLLNARASRAEAQLQLETGRSLDADAVRLAWANMVHVLRDGFLGLPTRMAPVLAPERDPVKIFALLTAAVEEILHNVADQIGNGGKESGHDDKNR